MTPTTDALVGARILEAPDRWFMRDDPEAEVGAMVRESRPDVYEDVIREEKQGYGSTA